MMTVFARVPAGCWAAAGLEDGMAAAGAGLEAAGADLGAAGDGAA